MLTRQIFGPRRRAATLALIFCAAVVLGLPHAVVSAEGGITLRIGIGEDPDVLDPARSRLFATGIVMRSLCDGLFTLDADRRIVPQLATGYEWSDAGRTLTLNLRQGVTFHDGTPFDAAAVKYNIERDINLPDTSARTYLGPITGVEVADPHIVRVKLSQPFAPLLAALSGRVGMMVSPQAAEAAGDKFGTKPVCAGPFRFVERVVHDRIVAERYPDYWDKTRIAIDRVVYLPIPDTTVRLANLQSGGLDLIERMATSDFGQTQRDANLKTASGGGLAISFVQFNTGNGDRAKAPIGRDKRVRQAFELAIDRNVLNEVVFDGQFLPTNQWIAPSEPGYAANLPMPPRDVAKAKALLAEAGVPNPSFELLLANTPVGIRTGEAIQSMAREAGFDVKLRVLEFVSALQASQKGDFDAFLFSLFTTPDPDARISPLVACDGPFNEGHYCDAGLDHILAEARSQLDPERRQERYQEVAAQVLDNRPVVFLWVPRLLYAYTKRLDGFRPPPNGLIPLQDLKLR